MPRRPTAICWRQRNIATDRSHLPTRRTQGSERTDVVGQAHYPVITALSRRVTDVASASRESLRSVKAFSRCQRCAALRSRGHARYARRFLGEAAKMALAAAACVREIHLKEATALQQNSYSLRVSLRPDSKGATNDYSSSGPVVILEVFDFV